MFEREIKFIYDFNVNKLNGLGSFFSFQQLRESDIHPAIIQYMSAELDYLIFEDRQKLVKDSIFDYSNDKVARYFSAIGDELKKSKRLSSDYAAKLILHAISFNVNFLVRPKWALVKFIFEEESHRSAADIKQLLNYLHFYKYLRKILISYLNNKKIISINSAEFIELLNKIDELTIESSFNEMIASSLKSMSEFFNIGGVHRTKIPFNAVQIFLDEKGLEKHLSRLRDIFSDDVNSHVELNDAVKLLTSIMPEKVETAAEPEKEEEIIEEETLFVDSFMNKEIEEKPEVSKKLEIEEEKPLIEEEINDFDKDEIEKAVQGENVNEEEPEPDDKDMIKNEFKNRETDESFELPEMEEKLKPEIRENGFEEEIIIETEKESDDEWEFVEEEEHADLIKEIAEAAEPETKKPKQAKKKNPPDDENLLLFDESEERMFNEVFEEEEKAYKDDVDISGSYEATHKDFTKLLEHKSMSNIIDVLFDNDIEEVELMLNSISFFTDYPEAERFIDTYFVKMGIKLDSIEAVTFKKIIRDNYNTGRQ